ncbi:GlxA family transcriptional regulator [Microvirga lotononidis]|uniref:Transcriptional regulator containing an amidase domain and an AraC-type DNA-binding HTH domain n=1 Tax=Microvirga lotononidis TaxID=864069 RepID=I4YQM4_9HYPH|nr:helix-turn-helix domain-containing protein [Microvirga lotononidis]EIM26266.1 transcriptional regulator containing an amidase domain and an AraC-type DNA-binding HTH domain [Microvirga lotononidis]WQO30642.1 helix-turn-helix domain-containing protein [Microvirga lotononidis]
MRMIRIWVYDGVLASGVSGPIDVFAAANRIAAKSPVNRRQPFQPIRWRVESLNGKPVHSASGQTVAVDGRIDARGRADAILVTAPFVADMEEFVSRREQLHALSSALRRQHAAGAVVASYCTGSYLLAEAGLLDGRIATTHWDRATDFARRYPRVELRANEVMTEQDRVLCTGAVTSFLNLALRLVEMIGDANLATTTAKALLIDTNRVSQASYATLLDEHGHSDRLVARAQIRMEATLQHGFRLSELAAYLAVSERTLNRRFKQAVGDTPLEYLQSLRIEVAKRLLEAGHASLEGVSQRIGYGDLSTFRELFKRKTGLTPREYQRRFARHASRNTSSAAQS